MAMVVLTAANGYRQGFAIVVTGHVEAKFYYINK